MAPDFPNQYTGKSQLTQIVFASATNIFDKKWGAYPPVAPLIHEPLVRFNVRYPSFALSCFIFANLNIGCHFGTCHVPIITVESTAVDHPLLASASSLYIGDLCESAV